MRPPGRLTTQLSSRRGGGTVNPEKPFCPAGLLQRLVRPLSTRRHKILGGHSNVTGNFAQQHRRNIPPLMEGHRRPATVRMAELLVNAALPDLDEAQRF